MVTRVIEHWGIQSLLAAEGASIWNRLTPLDRLRVTVGLIVVLILGMFIMLIVKAGSHMAKGFAAAANRLPKSSVPDVDDWARPTAEMRRDPESHDDAK